MSVQAFPMRGHDAWRRTLDIRERYLAAGDPDRLPPPDCGTDLPRDSGAVPPARLESEATTAGAPVRDPLTRRLIGLLNLNCHYVDVPPLRDRPADIPALAGALDVVRHQDRRLAGRYRGAARGRHLTGLERAERQALLTALRASGDREAAAADLGISRATIYRKLRRLGIREGAS
jgi:transcriptional regulator with AAA-type ATPase domain